VVDREWLRTLQIQREQVRSDASSVPIPLTATGRPQLDPYTARLNQLQGELQQLRTRYYEGHPDVVAKRREIADFFANNRPEDPEGSEVGTDPSAGRTARSPALAALDLQVYNAEKEISNLTSAQVKIRGEIDMLRGRIEATPQVEQELAELTKGYDVLQARYRDYQSKAGSAEGAQIIEESQRGEQFEVLERAYPPAFPVEPDPKRIYLIGLTLGLGIFVGPVLAGRFLHPLISSEAVLRGVTSVPLLVTVPRIQTPQVMKLRRAQRMRNLGFAVMSVAILFLVFAYYA
jgi:polysaccharide biosynthesis transport protein